MFSLSDELGSVRWSSNNGNSLPVENRSFFVMVQGLFPIEIAFARRDCGFDCQSIAEDAIIAEFRTTRRDFMRWLITTKKISDIELDISSELRIYSYSFKLEQFDWKGFGNGILLDEDKQVSVRLKRLESKGFCFALNTLRLKMDPSFSNRQIPAPSNVAQTWFNIAKYSLSTKRNRFLLCNVFEKKILIQGSFVCLTVGKSFKYSF